MEKRYKDILRPLVAELRRTLAGTADGSRRGDLDRELERLGLAPDGTIAMADVTPNPSEAERRARAVAAAELGAIADVKERVAARAAFVERATYGWIDRLLALRVLEARGLIDETLRANPDYDGLSEALYILRQDAPQRASGPDGGWWAVVEDACAGQAAALPGLFALDTPPGASSATLHDPAIALRPSTTALLRCVELLGGSNDAAFADPDAIGWAYQFYQEEAKAQVYARLKGGKKVSTRDEIAAATQLFTEPYMVKWLLQNSLGRSYHEAHPRCALPATWEYYLRPEQLDAPAFPALESLTLLDPCMGSGHFLREAFDMLVAMYREQQPELDATSIADRILARHLHGIDLDPRAAQLAAFTLYARAWELLRDERRARRQRGPGRYVPAALNLATTPGRIAPGALARHLQRHPGDRPLEPFLEGVFTALEHADILGSLLRPREHLQAAIAALRKPRQLQMQPDPDLQAVQEAIEAIVQTDPAHLEEMLLERVASSFAAEAGGDGDVAAALFGRAAERGVRLLQLLDRQYAVVATNPPYMGSKNMDVQLRQYVERHYAPGKRDLYAAFILRCLEAAQQGGRVAMVTQQSWMFLGSFAGLRAVPEDELAAVRAKQGFAGLLRETSLETLAHLGEFAFEEAAAAGAFAAMFVTARHRPAPEHTLTALRLVGLKSAGEKATALRRGSAGQANGIVSQPAQADFLPIPDAPVVYWLRPRFFEIFTSSTQVGYVAEVKQGLVTADNSRFLRCFWETPTISSMWPNDQGTERWFRYVKGGRYQKWAGLEWLVVDWGGNGIRPTNFGKGRIQAVEYYFLAGLTYTGMARGSMGVRLVCDAMFDSMSEFIRPFGQNQTSELFSPLMCALSTHAASWILRVLTQSLKFRGGYVRQMPLGSLALPRLNAIGAACVSLKCWLVANDPVERAFTLGVQLRSRGSDGTAVVQAHAAVQALLHTLEGLNEKLVCDTYEMDEGDVSAVMAETGTPAGWYPLLPGYDALPPLPEGLALQDDLCERLLTHLASQAVASLAQGPALKTRLRSLYEAGPGAAIVDSDTDDPAASEDDGESTVAGAYLPIPTETFLEELSQKLQIHPISVYWLLQEIRAEGARCKPEERRLLEDRLSVMVLRLLGHRWPKQIEAGEPVPQWADRDGIIPLQAGSGEMVLAERVRERLRAEDGALGAQQAEALLAELTGRGLEEWLRRDFFPRHVRQFKYRPIAWHLASTPQTAGASDARGRGRGGARSSSPAFECLVYYHACGAGLLARIRTQYVEPLLHAERGRASAARQAGDDTTAAQAGARVRELEAFTERLREVEERGFAYAELDTLLDGEPLDRWSGDGILAPSNHDALLAQERAWLVDVNDGVRVNIAPMQLAGVLASVVLKEPDARKAIADRARWRADERRWVREGVLPRCGWMGEDVPESPRWTERAPEREAERARLEAKRAEALRKLEGMEG